jgi:hypothetical protein
MRIQPLTPPTIAGPQAAQARELLRDFIESNEGLETLTELAFTARVVEDLTRLAVADARAGGASWADVGQALGITRQSAHERFTGR